MTRTIAIGGAIAFAVALVLLALFPRQGQSLAHLLPLQRGDMALLRIAPGPVTPETPFEDADGQARTLSDWRGHILIVNFWGRWCPPCVDELPSLAALAASFAADNVFVLAIAADRNDQKTANQDTLAKLTDGRLDFHFDQGWALARAVGVRGFPTTVIYDRRGREMARLSGAADWSGKDAYALVAAMNAD